MAQIIRALPYLIALGPAYQLISFWGWKDHSQPTEQEAKITARFQDFLRSQQIRGDVQFLAESTPLCFVAGSHFDSQGDAYCFYNPDFYKADEQAFSFFAKRELLRIKSNDEVIEPVVSIIGGIAAVYLFSDRGSIITASILAIAGKIIFGFSYLRYSAYRRSKTMLSLATIQELRGRIRLLRATIQENIISRAHSLFSSFKFLPSGEERFSPLFPSLSGAIAATKATLEDRRDSFAESSENNEVQQKLTLHVLAFQKAMLKKQSSLYRYFLDYALF